jgi:hypothetical protein
VRDAADSANCCTGSHNTAATCPSSGVQYYSYFSAYHPPRPAPLPLLMRPIEYIYTESNCTNSYAYAFDEGSGTALWTCPSTLNSDYRLTFCPYVLTLLPLFLPTDSARCPLQASTRRSSPRAHLGRPSIVHPVHHPYHFTHECVTTPFIFVLFSLIDCTGQSRSGSSSSATSTNASGNSNSASPSGGLALLRAMATWALSVPCAVLLIY